MILKTTDDLIKEGLTVLELKELKEDCIHTINKLKKQINNINGVLKVSTQRSKSRRRTPSRRSSTPDKKLVIKLPSAI